MIPALHCIVPINACIGGKKNSHAQCRELWQYLDHLESHSVISLKLLTTLLSKLY